MPPVPPKLFAKCFERFCKPSLYEELQGDLEEAFYENLETQGLKKAKSIYRKEVMKMLRPSVIKNFNPISSKIMLLPKNYLKTSIRAIRLNPFYVFANVFGLALALSVCTIGYFNYRFNVTFNTHFAEAKNLYKVHGPRTGQSTVGISSLELAPQLNLSGISAMRYTSERVSIRERDNLFPSTIGFVDEPFLDHFKFENLEDKTIDIPEFNEVVISQKLAFKLFDEHYPVGKLIRMVLPNQEERSFVIKDVYKELPTNTSFVQSAFLSIENYYDFYNLSKGDWSHWIDGTFVYGKPGELNRMEAELNKLMEIQNVNNPELVIDRFQLDNILKWPAFEGRLYGGNFRNHLHPSSVAGIAGSAIAILLLACFNFINTSIALSGKRLKEVAVRKILGGNRKSTMSQFLIENTFMITLAVLLSFGISYLLIPGYNALFQRELIQLENVPYSEILRFSITLILIVTLLSAAYPSLYVSKFSPIKIFRNKITLAGKSRLMAVLLTFQFALCFYNIFGLFLMVDNAYYQEQLDRGYDVDQVINIPLNRPEQFQVLRDQFVQQPDITGIAGSKTLIGFANDQQFLTHEGVEQTVDVVTVGENYLETLGLRLKAGSFFKNDVAEEKSVVINHLLQSQFTKDLLNQFIRIESESYKVIGIVDDFNLRSIMMDNKINPTIIKVAPPKNYAYTTVRIDGPVEAANKKIERMWYESFPQELYVGFPQNEVLNGLRDTNTIMIQINVFMAMITIMISILGLYTLISLKVQRRSKEFGIRKVLGASRKVIVHQLGKDLYWMLPTAATVGLSGSAIILSTVFDIIYAYHITPSINHFVQAILVVLLIIVATVAYKVYLTSKMNPVHQLRME